MSLKGLRFLHLERARERTGGPGERPRLEGGDRFASPSGPEQVPQYAERVTEAHVERFRSVGEVPLALDEGRSTGLPFLRCAGCGADSNRHATACGQCGADLHTPGQRALQARLWREWQEAQAREATALEALAQARRGEEALDPREVARLFEALRREEGAGLWERLARRVGGARAEDAVRRWGGSRAMWRALLTLWAAGVCAWVLLSPQVSAARLACAVLGPAAAVLALRLWLARPG